MSEASDAPSRSPRFTHWCAFLIFATITMASSVQILRDSGMNNSSQRYSIICSSITFAVAVIVVAMHLTSLTALLIVGTKIEGFLCLILVALWCVIVAVISDSKNGLAVDEQGKVSNGNLYYFSWAGFVCSVTLLVSYLRSAFNVDVAGEIRSRAARMNYWAALLATSLVVMGSATTIFTNSCVANGTNELEDAKFCRRTKFAISLGVIGTFFSLYCVAVKIATSKAPFVVEAAFSFLNLIMYSFGVAFVTSQYGPGAPLGNLYYFTWLSFFISFGLSASCYEDYQAAKNMSHQDDGPASAEGGDMPVEELDEDRI